jgi:hypothetical protein
VVEAAVMNRDMKLGIRFLAAAILLCGISFPLRWVPAEHILWLPLILRLVLFFSGGYPVIPVALFVIALALIDRSMKSRD